MTKLPLLIDTAPAELCLMIDVCGINSATGITAVSHIQQRVYLCAGNQCRAIVGAVDVYRDGGLRALPVACGGN